MGGKIPLKARSTNPERAAVRLAAL